MSDADEPMAVLRWDFMGEAGHRIHGEREMRTRSQAQAVCDIMNKIYGDGTHWVTVLNETWAERVAARAEGT